MLPLFLRVGHGERHVRFGLVRESFPEALALFGEHLAGASPRP